MNVKIFIGCLFSFLLFFTFPAPENAEAKAKGDVFRFVKEIGIVVEDIDSGLGYSADDVKKHVYTTLKSKLPLLKVSSVSYPYINVNIDCIENAPREHACYIETDFQRIVYLSDRSTFIVAPVWNQERRLNGKITFAQIKEHLDVILQSFTADYMKAQGLQAEYID